MDGENFYLGWPKRTSVVSGVDERTSVVSGVDEEDFYTSGVEGEDFYYICGGRTFIWDGGRSDRTS